MSKISSTLKATITNIIKRNIPVEDGSLFIVIKDEKQGKYLFEYMTTTAKNTIEITEEDYKGLSEKYGLEL